MRINKNDTKFVAVSRLSADKHNPQYVCIKLAQLAERAGLTPFEYLLPLDSAGIYEERIFKLYELCGERVEVMAEVLKAIGRNLPEASKEIIDQAIDHDGRIDFDAISAKVAGTPALF